MLRELKKELGLKIKFKKMRHHLEKGGQQLKVIWMIKRTQNQQASDLAILIGVLDSILQSSKQLLVLQIMLTYSQEHLVAGDKTL